MSQDLLSKLLFAEIGVLDYVLSDFTTFHGPAHSGENSRRGSSVFWKL